MKTNKSSENVGSAMIGGIYKCYCNLLILNLLSLRVGKATVICFDGVDTRVKLQDPDSMSMLSQEREQTWSVCMQ